MNKANNTPDYDQARGTLSQDLAGADADCDCPLGAASDGRTSRRLEPAAPARPIPRPARRRPSRPPGDGPEPGDLPGREPNRPGDGRPQRMRFVIDRNGQV